MEAKVFADKKEYSDVPGKLIVTTEAGDGKEIYGNAINNSNYIEFTYEYK